MSIKKILFICLCSTSPLALGMENAQPKSLKEATSKETMDEATLIKLLRAQCLKKYSDQELLTQAHTITPNEYPFLINGEPLIDLESQKPLYRVDQEPSDLMQGQRNLLCKRWAEVYSKMGTATTRDLAQEILNIEKILNQFAAEAQQHKFGLTDTQPWSIKK